MKRPCLKSSGEEWQAVPARRPGRLPADLLCSLWFPTRPNPSGLSLVQENTSCSLPSHLSMPPVDPTDYHLLASLPCLLDSPLCSSSQLQQTPSAQPWPCLQEDQVGCPKVGFSILSEPLADPIPQALHNCSLPFSSM